MRMGRVELVLAVAASLVVTVIGVVLAMTRAGTEVAPFGWFLAVVGAVSLVANVVLRRRMR